MRRQAFGASAEDFALRAARFGAALVVSEDLRVAALRLAAAAARGALAVDFAVADLVADDLAAGLVLAARVPRAGLADAFVVARAEPRFAAVTALPAVDFTVADLVFADLAAVDFVAADLAPAALVLADFAIVDLADAALAVADLALADFALVALALVDFAVLAADRDAVVVVLPRAAFGAAAVVRPAFAVGALVRRPVVAGAVTLATAPVTLRAALRTASAAAAATVPTLRAVRVAGFARADVGADLVLADFGVVDLALVDFTLVDLAIAGAGAADFVTVSSLDDLRFPFGMHASLSGLTGHTPAALDGANVEDFIRFQGNRLIPQAYRSEAREAALDARAGPG